MTNVERFIAECKNMDALVKQDNKAGKQWVYDDSGKYKGEKTFDLCREKNHRATSCVGGVAFGMLRSGVVGSTRKAIQWYGGKNTIVWLNDHAKEDLEKYYKIVRVNKTVKQALSEKILKAGDICTYVAMSHTNAYLGKGYWFDTGHANCQGSGDGAKFLRWVNKGTPYTNYKIAFILRLKVKEVKTYRVRLGIFSDLSNVTRLKKRVKEELKLDTFTEKHDDGTHVFCGSFNTKAKANERKKLLDSALKMETAIVTV